LRRPTPDELASAVGRTIVDVLAPGLDVVFCGINPGLYSGAVGHHFARPGNRFWPVLHRSGFTPRQLSPDEERELLSYGLGVTNICARTTARADELTTDEIRDGARRLRRKIRRHRPRWLAVLGLTAYRVAFDAPDAEVGEQPLMVADTRIWLLPNPSGLNAHYQMDALVYAFTELRRCASNQAATRSEAGPTKPSWS